MGWNEIVVDGRGNVHSNGGSGITVLTSDGLLRQVADGIAFPNGMAITPDNSTLMIAESYGEAPRNYHCTVEDGTRAHANHGGSCSRWSARTSTRETASKR
jgi:sugar lactone lactonase YvrE